jgi:hypothetical protein
MVKLEPQIATEENFDDISEGELHRLTSGLAALCSASEKKLNKIELNAVFGMIAYVAHTQNVAETIVAEVLTSHFGISAVAGLPSRFYQNTLLGMFEILLVEKIWREQREFFATGPDDLIANRILQLVTEQIAAEA